MILCISKLHKLDSLLVCHKQSIPFGMLNLLLTLLLVFKYNTFNYTIFVFYMHSLFCNYALYNVYIVRMLYRTISKCNQMCPKVLLIRQFYYCKFCNTMQLLSKTRMYWFYIVPFLYTDVFYLDKTRQGETRQDKSRRIKSVEAST